MAKRDWYDFTPAAERIELAEMLMRGLSADTVDDETPGRSYHLPSLGRTQINDRKLTSLKRMFELYIDPWGYCEEPPRSVMSRLPIWC